ncbi:MAG: hypothetical protein GF317_12035, partial [Candidatus Lokiarchaeota archaeon]|nr:hypothetical protein [Candidatus Lokiarchaeota archaeon]
MSFILNQQENNANMNEIMNSKYKAYMDLLDVKNLTRLKEYPIGHHGFLINSDLGYYPYFTVELRDRIRKNKVINCVVTGEAGLGKSYMASDFCRSLAPKTFSVDDIVFTYEEFLRCVVTSPRGTPIEYDEPSYAMSKKDWFKEITKALVKTIESFRFKGKPLFIPIINKALLEKDIRSYLIQYQVSMKDRGKATAYRIYTSQFQDKQYNYGMCDIEYKIFDKNLCDRDSCLRCRKLFNKDYSKRCKLFRAKYERKKANIQDKRYDDDLQEAKNKTIDTMSLDEVEQAAMPYFDKFYDEDNNKIDVDMMAVVLWREEGIKIGHNKKYR